MEGPILAEFSSLNALGSRAKSEGARRRSSARPSRMADSKSSDASDTRERLLRGEATYTSTDQYIEDQPQGAHFGMGHLLPQASSTEDREKLLRRLEMCAKAREESSRVMSMRFAKKDLAMKEIKKERFQNTEMLQKAQQMREERWGRRLQKSPFAVDLVAVHQRVDEENRVKNKMEQKRAREEARQAREAHDGVFRHAALENDELDQLRKEKKALLENERRLKALKDVEKSNARTAQILAERRKQQVSFGVMFKDSEAKENTAETASTPRGYGRNSPVSASGANSAR